MFDINSREAAFLLWIALLLLIGLLKPKVRRALLNVGDVLRALFRWKILFPITLATAYVAAAVAFLAAVNIWSVANLKTTIMWGIGFAFVTMLDVNRLDKGPRALVDLAKEALAVTAIIVFIAEFHTLPLLLEFLIVVPLMTIIGWSLAVVEEKNEHALALNILTIVQASIVLGILTYSAYHIVRDLRGFATPHTAREFSIPILLSLMFLPFLYGLMIVMTYERAERSLRFSIKNDALRQFALRRLKLDLRWDIDLVERFLRDINVTPVDDRDAVRQHIARLKRLKQREKNPPPIPISEGWSPHLAGRFLTNEEIVTGDYHFCFDNWVAEAPFHYIGKGILRDYLSYRVYGTEEAVTRLKLTLEGTLSRVQERPEERFWKVAENLVARALGKASAEEFVANLKGQEGEATFSNAVVTVSRRQWGNDPLSRYEWRIQIRHSAHRRLPYEDD